MTVSPNVGPQLSPDGGSIAYVKDDELYVIPTAGGDTIQITSGSRGTDKKMQRRPCFWWSPDSRLLAISEVDATAFGDSEAGHDYSFAEVNLKLRLGIVPAAGGDVTWLQLHTEVAEVDDEEYLMRVMWLPDGHLTGQVRNRAKTMKTLKFDPRTGTRQDVLTEESGNIQDCFTSLQKGTQKPQSDCNLLPPMENGEPTTFEDNEVQCRATGLVQQNPALFDGLCGQCLQLLHQRLSGVSLPDVLTGFQDQLAHLTPLGSLSTSSREVRKNILTSSVCSQDGTTADSILSNTSSEIVGQHEKPRLWSEEIGDEAVTPVKDHQDCESQSSLSGSADAPSAKISVSAAVEASQGGSEVGLPLSLSEQVQLTWANATLTSPEPARQGQMASSSPGSPSPVDQKEASKPKRVETVLSGQQTPEKNKRKKLIFTSMERIHGNSINVVEGLELYNNVFTSEDQEKLVNFVYASQQKYQQKGRGVLKRDRTYTEPRKWMPGKGRVTIQFGCCYNYAVDNRGNPPGILHDEIVDPLPPLLKIAIRRLIKWHILPESCVPDSCIINIYDVGDCIPPHIDHHDFFRPFCTVSLLSECSIVFGSKLRIVGDGLFDGPISIPLPVGSVLVLKGNGADVAKHAVPGVPTKRISITFRKMDPTRVPRGYELPMDLRNVKALPLLN